MKYTICTSLTEGNKNSYGRRTHLNKKCMKNESWGTEVTEKYTQ